MGLTLEAQQRLESAKLIAFFEVNKTPWQTAAQESYSYLVTTFPVGSTIRPDDVAKVLYPVIEVSTSLQAKLDSGKLKQKFWKRHFTDLIIDRVWTEISKPKEDGDDGSGAS